MSTPVFYRRRAERFAQLLDEPDGGRRHHTRSPLDDDLTELVAVGHRMSALEPNVEVSPKFRTDLRAMLIATAEREGIGASAAAGPPAAKASTRSRQSGPARRGLRPALDGRRARVRGAIIAGVAVGAIAVSGISTASDNSLPGDPLYGMKRSTERAQLALAGSDLGRGQLLLEFARTRLNEAGAVRGDSDAVVTLLDHMDATTRQGVKLLTTTAVDNKDEEPLDVITAFLADQQGRLVELSDTGGADRERAAESGALLDAIAKRVDDLRRWLACGPDPTGAADSLGPRPHKCIAGSGPSGNPVGSRQQGQRPDRGTPRRAAPTAGGGSLGATTAAPAAGSGGAPSSTPDPSASASPKPTDEDDRNGHRKSTLG